MDMIVRTDSEDGSQELCSWDRAEAAVRKTYHPADGVLRQLALGHAIATGWATYQHRDWVPGFEREER